MTAWACAVSWTRTRDARPGDVALLTADELARAQEYGRPADRDRYVVATALLRRRVAEAVGEPPERLCIDRRCAHCGRLHGRPIVVDHRIHVSITHSGTLIGVALSTAGPVGVDAEQMRALDVAALAGAALADDEAAADAAGFLRYWTRKEAVVKATGDGLAADLRAVAVTPPGEPAALVRYPGRALDGHLADLEVVAGYVGAVAVLATGPVPVTELWS